MVIHLDLIVYMILQTIQVLMLILLKQDGLWMDLLSMEDISAQVLLDSIARNLMIVVAMTMILMDIIIMHKFLMDKLKGLEELQGPLLDKLTLLLLMDLFNVIKLIFHNRLITGLRLRIIKNYINLVVI